jgi:negative regulator of flagellin synthesis FlgM
MDTQEKAVETKKTGTADKVDISGKSRKITDIMAAINQLPDVRDARVQEIKQSVEAGTYTVDPRKIAEKMIKGL